MIRAAHTDNTRPITAAAETAAQQAAAQRGERARSEAARFSAVSTLLFQLATNTAALQRQSEVLGTPQDSLGLRSGIQALLESSRAIARDAAARVGEMPAPAALLGSASGGRVVL